MKLLGNRKSKRTKLSLKYNIQKRVRENKRRVRKEAKRLGVKKRGHRDPGIPNSWPFKAEMLQELERKKDQREKELAQRKEEAKNTAREAQKQREAEAKQAALARDAERRAKRAADVDKSQKDVLKRMLQKCDVLLEVLDARDPIGCRCEALEAWAQEAGKRVVLVLTKADLVTPTVVSRWLQVLGQLGPTVAVQAEAGREGVGDLMRLLGHPPAKSSAAASGAPTAAPAEAVACVGYASVGKKTLAKAIRREAHGPIKWLLESVGRLRPASELAGNAAKLRAAVRGVLPQGQAKIDAVQTVRHFLERANLQTVMRRWRLPAFEGPDDFLSLWAKNRSLKNKRGNDAGLEFTARRVLADLSALPGCVCLPPEAAGGNPMWPAHSASRPAIEAVMQAQIAAMGEKGVGPTASGITLSSGSFGPDFDVKGALKDDEVASADGDEMSDESSDGEGEEEEDGEEDVEGEESEEGDMED
mmetsp:Transcript_125740/g.367432  ORF Transcript_125740/g.367432 Transcript_125740/m.367432 type:complete len:474 (-) Transcript_125740:97-1518(-)